MKKTIKITAIIFLFICCTKKSESFSDVNFGHISKDKFLKQMLENETFFVYHDDPKNPKDTTDIGYKLRYNGNEFPMTVYFNEEPLNKKYHVGKLRRMGFWLGEDKNEYGRIHRSSGKISKEFVDNLFDAYVSLYGKPDSLTIKNKYKYKNKAEDIFAGRKPDVLDNSMYPSKRAVWTTNKFKLVFNIPSVEKPTPKNKKSYFEYGTDIEILFEMNGYEKEIKHIHDSIAKTLKPENLVFISVGDCQWTKNQPNPYEYNDSRMSIQLPEITRIEYLDEERSIKGVRFDLIITDSFKKELYKAEDLTIELDRQSYLESRPRKGSFGITNKVHLNQEYYRNFNSIHDQKLVFLKNYAQNNKIIIKAIPKIILFEDGSTLISK